VRLQAGTIHIENCSKKPKRSATKTHKTRSLDESAKATLGLAERFHLPQKINPGGESAHGQPETNFGRPLRKIGIAQIQGLR
jgi:hypothetical protein